MNRNASITLAATGILLLTAGCTGGSNDADGMDAVLRLDFHAGGAHAGLFLAKERGYYEDAGINIEILDGTGSANSIQQVASGTDDFAWASMPALISSVNADMPVQSVSVISNQNSYGVFIDEDSDIEELADLPGHGVLVVAGTPDVYLLEAALSSNGIDPSEVRMQNVDASAKINLYTQGQEDGVVTLIPFGSPIIQEPRPSKWLLFSDAGQVLVDYGLVANKNMIEEDPDLVRGFVEASLKGWHDALEDPEAAVQAVVDNREDLRSELVRQQYDLAIEFFDSERSAPLAFGCASLDDWTDSIALLSEFADMPDLSGAEVADFYTTQFMPECAETTEG